METKKTNKKVSLERVVGIIFLIPPALGVIFFLLSVFIFINRIGDIPALDNLSSNWTGNYNTLGDSHMSAAPIYLGLMAIAAAVLLKDSRK